MTMEQDCEGSALLPKTEEKKENEASSSGSTSTLGTVFLIINTVLGAGILNFPQAFDQAGGVVVAIIVQAVLLLFILSSLIILTQTSEISHVATLQDTMFTAAGVWGRRITSLTIGLYCFGTCVTFLIIIGDQFDRALFSFVGPQFCSYWYLNRDFLMPITCVVLILPMCYTKKIDFLKFTSVMGVLAIVYVIIIMIWEFALGDYTRGEIKTAPDNVSDLFLVIPVICFGYQCHISAVPIYSCMEHKNTKSYSLAAVVAIGACVLTYTGAATLGYLTFGSFIKSDILTNYSASKPSVMIALVMMAFKTVTTYPILLFCGREAISSIVKDLWPSQYSPNKDMILRVVIASLWFFLSLVLAVSVPNMGAVVKILGALASTFIFVFPGICLLQTTLAQEDGIKRLAKITIAMVFITFGTFIFGVVLAQGISFNLSEGHNQQPLCVPNVSVHT